MVTGAAIDQRRADAPQLRLLERVPALASPAGEELIERVLELGVLDDAVGRLAEATGSVVVIEAAAGLGKTALLEHFEREASTAGNLVRRATPGPGERDFAFGVVRSLLEAPLRELTEAQRAELLTDAAAPAATMLLTGTAPDACDVTVIAHGIFWVCAWLAARRPLALIVDDAQWADRASLEVLAYLARRIEDIAVAVIVSARAGDPAAAADLLSLLGAARSATVLHPVPLSATGAVHLIRSLAPEASIGVCRECHRAVAGSPWLLSELARQLADHGPEALDRGQPVSRTMLDTVRRLLAELAPRERAIATALAVIGDAAPPQAIATVAGVGVDDLGGAGEAMAAAGLLNDDGDCFAHELIASAIRDTLSVGEVERLHRESARALMSLQEPAEVIAAHLLHSRPQGDADVSGLLQGAADLAAQRGAAAVAVTYLERALSERSPGDDRGRMLARLATVAFHAGLPDSRRRLRDALLEARDLSSRLDVLTRLAALGVARGDDPGLSHLLERIALDADDESRLAVETTALDALMTLPGTHAERARRAAAIELTDTTDPLMRRVVLAHRAWLATEGGTPNAAAAAALALEAIDDGTLLREAWQRTAYHLCVRALIVTDHVDQARRAIADLAADANARGSRRLQAIASWYAAELALRTGQVAEAERLAGEALELADDEIRACIAGAAGVLVSALTERGAFMRAHGVLGELGLDGCLGGCCPSHTSALLARARLALAEGDFERAYTEACEVGAGCDRNCLPNPTWSEWRSTAALALAHLGRRTDAVALADDELELAQRFGTPLPIARALHARAVAEPDDCERVALCNRALSLLDGRPATLEAARLRLELGSTLSRIGRRVEARDALRPALAEADAAGASLLADRARRELVATGLRPRRAAVDGAEALTPRQRQISELAAAGKGNRAIAQQLFLSIKTVETHLAAAYRKLGVSVRAELGAALAG